MSDYSLAAQSPLDDVRLDIGKVTISEVSNLAMVSVATPLGGEKALASSIQSSYKACVPAPGKSSTSSVDNARLLGLQKDQFFMLFDYSGPEVVTAVREKIVNTAYISDQSDSWAMLRVAGKDSRKALERICPIDLHPMKFGAGSVARTVMEHIGVIIFCEAPDSYLLLSLRSYAKSFLHAVETSAKNI